MKKILFPGIICFLMFSCGEENVTPDGLTSLSFDIGIDESINAQNISSGRITTTTLGDLEVKVFDASNDEIVETFSDATQIPASFEIEAGTYYATASNNETSGVAFEAPVYFGQSSNVTVSAGQTQTISLTVSIQNVKVSVNYSQEVVDNFTNYSTSVTSTSGSLTFSSSETQAGYFPAGENLSIVVTADDITLEETITGTEAKDHFILNVNYTPNNGNGGIDITIDDSTNDEVIDLDLVDPNSTTEVTEGTITGDITTNVLIKSGNTIGISGPVTVKTGYTLTIEEGVTIEADADPAKFTYLLVEKGAQIIANGSDTSPIVFTSSDSNPSAGDWVGLYILGNAPVSSDLIASNEAFLPTLNSSELGGSIATDNSGSLNFVRIEYAGRFDFNGTEYVAAAIGLFGVGDGTTVNNIQSFYSLDDGMEVLGGTVDISNFASNVAGDDHFDYASGYTGSINQLYLYNGSPSDAGIEGNGDLTPTSNPTIMNVTIDGQGQINRGLRIRDNTQGSFENIVIKNITGTAVDIRDNSTLTNIGTSLTFSSLYANSIGGATVDSRDDDGNDENSSTSSATLITDAEATINAAFISTEPSGANFSSWKGNWVREN